MDIGQARGILFDIDIDLSITNRIFLGMQILATVSEELPMRFEHDQVWICDFEETVEKMDEGTINKMGRYGWFEDEESWSHYS